MKSWVFVEILTGFCPVILAGKPAAFTLQRVENSPGFLLSL
jgi:hypothetical protein